MAIHNTLSFPGPGASSVRFFKNTFNYIDMSENFNPNEEQSASQAKRILAYMQTGHRITGLEALDMFGCFRLPSRITDLRNKGYDISSRFVKTASGKSIKEYWIEDRTC